MIPPRRTLEELGNNLGFYPGRLEFNRALAQEAEDPEGHGEEVEYKGMECLLGARRPAVECIPTFTSKLAAGISKK